MSSTCQQKGGWVMLGSPRVGRFIQYSRPLSVYQSAIYSRQHLNPSPRSHQIIRHNEPLS
jgi:hypothetical protein